MAIDYKLLGKRIKKIRLIKGKTQEQLAEEFQVSVGYISQLERGITKISLDRLVDISDSLECNISALLEGCSEQSSDYLNTELTEYFDTLSPKERKLLCELLKTYEKYKV